MQDGVCLKIIGLVMQFLNFVDNSSILSGLVVAGLVGWSVQYVFFSPKFELRLWNEKKDELHIQLESMKNFVGYDYGSVFFTIYFPEKIFTELVIEQRDINDDSNPWKKLKPFGKYKILDEVFLQFKGTVRNNLHPNRPTIFLRVTGKLDMDLLKGHTIYAAFSTKYGTYPRIDSSEKAKKGELPHIVINERSLNHFYA